MSAERSLEPRSRENEFVVAIGRDPSILAHAKPDLVITTNELEGMENIETISLASFLHENKAEVEQSIRKLMPLYDTNFLALLFYDPQNDGELNEKKQLENKYSHIPEEWLAQAASLQDKIHSLILEKAQGRKVVINPYHSAYALPKKWSESGFILQSPDAKIAYEFASKMGARNLALNTKMDSGEIVPVRDGEIVDADKVEETIKKLGGDVFISSDDDPFFSHNTRVNLNRNPEIPKLREGVRYLVTEWHTEEDGKQHSPNSQVIIGDSHIEYLGQLDQIIKDNVRYGGNIFPSDSTPEVQEKIRQYSMALAREMQAKGYRGFVGFDWIEAQSGVDKGKVWLAEINPRKNRSTGLLAAILNHVHGHVSITDIERRATSGQPMKQEYAKTEFGQFAQMETYHPSRPVFVPADAKDRLLAAGVSFDEKPDPADGAKLCILNFPKAGTYIYPKESANIIRLTSYDQTREKARDGAVKLRALLDKVLNPI